MTAPPALGGDQLALSFSVEHRKRPLETEDPRPIGLLRGRGHSVHGLPGDEATSIDDYQFPPPKSSYAFSPAF